MRKLKPALGKGHLIGLMREQLEHVDVPEIIREADRIGPTPERLARAIEGDDVLISEVEMGDGAHKWRAMRLDDAPLGRLRDRKKIDREQFNAGEAFYGVAYYAGMMPSPVLDPSRDIVDGGQHKHMPDRLIAAKAKYERIIKGMAHPLWHITDAIVVQEMPLADYAERFQRVKERRARQAVALDRLCMGLDWLIEYFDLGAKAGRTRSFVGERPIIMPADSR